MAAPDPSGHRKLSLRDRTRAKFDSLLRSIDKQQSKKIAKKSPKKVDDQSKLQRSKSSSISSDSSETTSGYINPIYQDDRLHRSRRSSQNHVQSDVVSSAVSKRNCSKSNLGSESSVDTDEGTLRQGNTSLAHKVGSTNSDDDLTPESILERTIRESVWEKTMQGKESSSALSNFNGAMMESKSSNDFIILERQAPEKPYEHDNNTKLKKKRTKLHEPLTETFTSDSMEGVRKFHENHPTSESGLDLTSSSARQQEVFSSKPSTSVETNDALVSVWWKATTSDSNSTYNQNVNGSLEMTSLTNTARQKRRARKQHSVTQLSEGETLSTVTTDLLSPQQSEGSYKIVSDTSQKYSDSNMLDNSDQFRTTLESSSESVTLSRKTVPKKRAKSLTRESHNSPHTASLDVSSESFIRSQEFSQAGSFTSTALRGQAGSSRSSSRGVSVVESLAADDTRPLSITAPPTNVPVESSDSDSAEHEVVISKTSAIDLDQPVPIKESTKAISEITKALNTETENLKKKKKKKKEKKVKSVEDAAAVTQEPSGEHVFSEVLGVLVHRVDGLKMNLLICHPVVQVHIFDVNTGSYLQKKHQEQPVASFYENQSALIKHILPMMTQPYHMSGKKSLIPEWQELLVFNEDYNYFVQEEPSVILFFEILDFVSMSQASRQYKYLGKDGGWCRIAWAFLKLVGSNSVLNVGKRLRLQLYYPPKTKWGSACAPTSAKEVYSWWRKGLKKKYPYTLYITVKGIPPPEVRPGLRSMIPTQEERGRETLEELEKNLTEGKPAIDTNITDTKPPSEKIRWTRLRGQTCKLPEMLHLSLQAGRSGCFVVRFSHGGRFLACGTADGDGYPILIFEIPTGKLQGKLVGHFGIVYDIVWLPNDETIISVSADCTMRLWDMNNVECESSVMLPHPSYVYAATHHLTSPTLIVSGCYDNIVRVWQASVSDCELLQELPAHKSFINSVCFDEEGDRFYSGDGLGVICVWSNNGAAKRKKKIIMKDWTLLQKIKLDELQNIAVNDIIRHPGGHRLLISSRDNCVRLVDAREFTVLHIYKGFQNLNDHMHCCITPCGSYIFTGSEEGTIHVWRTNTEEKVYKYTKLPFNKTVTTVDFHSQEHMMVCCAYGENLPVLVFKHKTSVPTTAPLPETSESSLLSVATPRPMSETSRGRSKPPSGILKHTQLQADNIASEHPSITSAADTTNTTSSEMLPATQPLLLPEFGLTTAERQRTVKFEDEMTPPTKWNDMFAKIDAVLAFSSLKRDPSKYLPPLKFDSSTPIYGKNTLSATSMQDTASSWGSTFDQDTFEEYSMQSSSLENFKVVVLYAYTAANEDQLSLQVGDQILVLRKINDDWWYGRDCNGKNGLFPANYVFPTEESQSDSGSPIPSPSTSSTSGNLSSTSKQRTRKTCAIPSQSGSYPLFVSGSEDEEYTA